MSTWTNRARQSISLLHRGVYEAKEHNTARTVSPRRMLKSDMYRQSTGHMKNTFDKAFLPVVFLRAL